MITQYLEDHNTPRACLADTHLRPYSSTLLEYIARQGTRQLANLRRTLAHLLRRLQHVVLRESNRLPQSGA